jgi:hypothetical protein
MAKLFDEFTSGDDIGFTKTIVPVSLLKYGNEQLVSRSQAKRLLVRFDRFREVLLDFEGIDAIGQAFADEVFRVFPSGHPDITVTPIGMNSAVERMYLRAISTS